MYCTDEQVEQHHSKDDVEEVEQRVQGSICATRYLVPVFSKRLHRARRMATCVRQQEPLLLQCVACMSCV